MAEPTVKIYDASGKEVPIVYDSQQGWMNAANASTSSGATAGQTVQTSSQVPTQQTPEGYVSVGQNQFVRKQDIEQSAYNAISYQNYHRPYSDLPPEIQQQVRSAYESSGNVGIKARIEAETKDKQLSKGEWTTDYLLGIGPNAEKKDSHGYNVMSNSGFASNIPTYSFQNSMSSTTATSASSQPQQQSQLQQTQQDSQQKAQQVMATPITSLSDYIAKKETQGFSTNQPQAQNVYVGKINENTTPSEAAKIGAQAAAASSQKYKEMIGVPATSTKYTQAENVYTAIEGRGTPGKLEINVGQQTTPTNAYARLINENTTPTQAAQIGAQAADQAKEQRASLYSTKLESMEQSAKTMLGDQYSSLQGQLKEQKVINPEILYSDTSGKYYSTGLMAVNEVSMSKEILGYKYSSEKVPAVNTATVVLSPGFTINKTVTQRDTVTAEGQPATETITERKIQYDENQKTETFGLFRYNLGQQIKPLDVPESGVILGGQYISQYDAFKGTVSKESETTKAFEKIPIVGKGLASYAGDVGVTIGYGVTKAEVGFAGKTNPLGYGDVALAVGDAALTSYTVFAMLDVGTNAARTVGKAGLDAAKVGKAYYDAEKGAFAEKLGSGIGAGTYTLVQEGYAPLAKAIETPIASNVARYGAEVFKLDKIGAVSGALKTAAEVETVINKVSAPIAAYYIATGKQDDSNPLFAYASGRAEYFARVGRVVTFQATPEERRDVVVGFTLANLPYYYLKTASPSAPTGSKGAFAIDTVYRGLNVWAYSTYTAGKYNEEYARTGDAGKSLFRALGSAHANFATFDYYAEEQTIDKVFEKSGFYKDAQKTALTNIKKGKLDAEEFASRPSSIDLTADVSQKMDAKPENRFDIKIEGKTDVRIDIKPDIKFDIKPDQRVDLDLKPDNKIDIRPDYKLDTKPDQRFDIRTDLRSDLRSDLKEDLKQDLKQDLKMDFKFPSMPPVIPLLPGGGGGNGYGRSLMGARKLSGKYKDLLSVQGQARQLPKVRVPKPPGKRR